MFKTKLTALAFLLLSVSSSGIALAEDVNVYLPFTGWAFVGTINGETWVGISQDAGESCVWWKRLSGTGGLTQHWFLRGTGGNDFINVTNTTIPFCGFTMSSTISNDFLIDIDGQGGHDVLFGGWATRIIRGGAGNDDLTGKRSNTTLIGDNGNNVYFISTQLGSVTGGADADIACVKNPGGTRIAAFLSGGNGGADRRCGTASWMDGWELTGCQSPCN
jgi:Ca2+-binding RTX toxin-like protein